MSEHPEDLPWNDSPADSDAPFGNGDPDPAEVDGDEDDPAREDRSLGSRPSGVDEYHRDTIDERLSEEEPDVASQFQEPEAGDIQAPENGDDDVSLLRGEPDRQDGVGSGAESAEEAAIHVIPEGRL